MILNSYKKLGVNIRFRIDVGLEIVEESIANPLGHQGSNILNRSGPAGLIDEDTRRRPVPPRLRKIVFFPKNLSAAASQD